MTANLLRRRAAPIVATAALIAAGIPALLAPAQAGAHPHPHPHPHASAPSDRVGYAPRPVASDSTVPQRTGAI